MLAQESLEIIEDADEVEEDELETATAVLLSPDERFAAAVCSRTLGELPPLLGDDAPELDTVARSLETCLRAAQPRESLLLRTLRRTLECGVRQ